LNCKKSSSDFRSDAGNKPLCHTEPSATQANKNTACIIKLCQQQLQLKVVGKHEKQGF
jgi:hypothetical protein